MRFFLQPDNLGPYLEGSLARWFPVDKRLIEHALLEGPERTRTASSRCASTRSGRRPSGRST